MCSAMGQRGVVVEPLLGLPRPSRHGKEHNHQNGGESTDCERPTPADVAASE